MPSCKNCNQPFTITPQEGQFYRKINSPDPLTCYNCRRQELFSFWPFGNFYQRQCDFSGENIISTFSPQAPFPVYKKEYWLKDTWTSPEAEVDVDQPFFLQLEKLQKQTPHYHFLSDGTCVNCDYCDDIYLSKNCYLTRSVTESEDLYFCYRVFRSKDCFDCVYSMKLEKCFSCTRCWSCYNTYYSFESRDCLDSCFLYDCRGCKNCLLCWNLRNAEYCIENKKYSPEEYGKKIAEINFGSWKKIGELKGAFRQILQNQAVHRVNFNIKTINSGDNYLTECKGCQNCFFMEESVDNYNVVRGLGNKDSANSTGAYRFELCNFINQSVDCYNVKFANYAVRCRDCEYLEQCEDCHDCFGCVGLKKRSYCLLNKQYQAVEYQKLVKILREKMSARGEYGRLFPLSMTYTGYNDSLAYFYFPETKEKVLAKGGWWQEELAKEVKADLNAENLPDSIAGVKDEEMVNKTIQCAKTGKIFRYAPQELKFYRDNHIPLPRYYYNYRITENFKQLAPFFSREVNCGHCGKKITTYYPAEWGYQKIYCEECYQKEIY